MWDETDKIEISITGSMGVRVLRGSSDGRNLFILVDVLGVGWTGAALSVPRESCGCPADPSCPTGS